MTKQILKRELQRITNGSAVISERKLSQFLSLGQEKTKKLFDGLERLDVGNREVFFIDDVANRLQERIVK